MKIIYIEDQLAQNIKTIIFLFKQVLGKKRIKQLEKIKESGYIKEEKLIEIIEDTGIIDVASNFPDALKKFNNHLKEYSLFIVDRNLAKEPIYELSDIQQVYPDYTEEQYDNFFEREGDFLLELLISSNENYKTDNFFFLTANKDDLRNREFLQNHIDFKRFKVENIIEKGDEHKLVDLINNIHNLDIILENKVYLNYLKRIGEKTKGKFIELMKNKDKNDAVSIFQNLVLIRNIFENTISHLAKTIPDHNCWNPKNKTQLLMWPFIAWIKNYNKENKVCNFRYNANSIIYSSLSSVWSIGSDFGDHDGDGKRKSNKGFQPTSNTVNALVYELKDIILWFGDILE